MKKFLSLFLILALCLCPFQIYAEDTAAFYVNGEAVSEEELEAVEQLLLSTYESYGIDSSSEEILAHAEEEARTQLIQEKVILQYAQENGLSDLSEKELTANEEAASYAWEYLVESYLDSYSDFISTEEEEESYRVVIEGLLAANGYTEESIYEELCYQTIGQHITDFLIAGIEISEEEIEQYYEELKKSQKKLYEEDPSLYEFALSYGADPAVYIPETGFCELDDSLREELATVLLQEAVSEEYDKLIESLADTAEITE